MSRLSVARNLLSGIDNASRRSDIPFVRQLWLVAEQLSPNQRHTAVPKAISTACCTCNAIVSKKGNDGRSA